MNAMMSQIMEPRMFVQQLVMAHIKQAEKYRIIGYEEHTKMSFTQWEYSW